MVFLFPSFQERIFSTRFKKKKKKDSNCAKLDVTVRQRKRRIKGEVDERSSEDEGVRGEALFGLSQPYLGCGGSERKKGGEHQNCCQI